MEKTIKAKNTINIVTKELIEQIQNANAEQLKVLIEKYEGRNFFLDEMMFKRAIEIVSK